MKILFVIPSFGIGGTTTSLISLISKIDKTRYELFVYAINNEGNLMQEISKYARVLNSQRSDTVSSNKPEIKSRLLGYAKLLYRVLRTVGVDVSSFYFKRIAKSLDAKKIDCVIAFQEGLATQLVSYCTRGKKVAWVRSEYRRYLMLSGKKPENRLYSKFDIIFSVSETAINQFLRYLPQFQDKANFMYNLINKDRVLNMAMSPCEIRKSDVFTIVSIGRIDRVKRFSEIPHISSILMKKGIVFRWLVIGGPQKTEMDEYWLLEKGIKEKKLEDVVILMGKKENPYNYLKNSDLLVCLSESETFNHTFGEARLLGLPVISTNYESASEILKTNQGGIIVERESIPKAIESIIRDKEKYEELCLQVEGFNYDNEAIIEKFYEIINKQ